MSSRTSKSYFRFSVLLATVSLISLTTGCGGGVAPSPPVETLHGNTQVVLLLSSTSNDRWTYYDLSIENISLTNRAGKEVTLFSSSGHAQEFLHLNAASEPLATVSVPQAVYTSASVAYTLPTIGCMSISSTGGFEADFYSTMTNGPASVTINFPSPITISGTAESLLLNLQVPQSTDLTECLSSSSGTVPPNTEVPVFILAPVPIVSQPTNISNGKESGIAGRTVSVDAAGNALSLNSNEGSAIPGGDIPPTTFKADAYTTFQGIGGLSDLLAGTFVNLDAAIQPDGSFLATRVEVPDASATNMWIGPLAAVYGSQGSLTAYGWMEQGDDLDTRPSFTLRYSFDASTSFRISGRFSNPQGLPLTPAFNASSMFAGQNVAIGSGAIPATAAGGYPLATTITLMPQTLDGTIAGASSAAGYEVYSLQLASYDPIAVLTGVQGQSTSLANPNMVQVYVNGNTQILGSSPLQVGGVARFRGLLFNDGGNLRMVCLTVSNGVPE